MNTLPVKGHDKDDVVVEEVPTWHELRQRAADLLKALVREGKELERDLEPRVLPALKGLKARIEKLIAKLEERVAHRDGPPGPTP